MPKVSDAHLETRRQQILEAARACFARRGFHKTTMRDICAAAALSPGAVYRYFASKEEIIEACSSRRQAARDTRFAAARQRGAGTISILDALVDAYLARSEGPDTAQEASLAVQLWAEATRNPLLGDILRLNWDDLLERAAAIIVPAQRRGEINPDLDPRAVGRLFLAVHDGLELQKNIDTDLDVGQCAAVLKALYRGDFWRGAQEGSHR